MLSAIAQASGVLVAEPEDHLPAFNSCKVRFVAIHLDLPRKSASGARRLSGMRVLRQGTSHRSDELRICLSQPYWYIALRYADPLWLRNVS